jgi:hypothetical protein
MSKQGWLVYVLRGGLEPGGRGGGVDGELREAGVLVALD